MDNRVECECGAEVLWVINAEFPGMGLVLNPEPAAYGMYRVGRYGVTGQMFGRMSDALDGSNHNPHSFDCPLDKPRRARS